MEFRELDSIIKRLNADYGVTSITMSEDGFAQLTEQIKPYIFKTGAIGQSEAPNCRVMPRIGNVLIEVKPKHMKPVFDTLRPRGGACSFVFADDAGGFDQSLTGDCGYPSKSVLPELTMKISRTEKDAQEFVQKQVAPRRECLTCQLWRMYKCLHERGNDCQFPEYKHWTPHT